VKPIRRIKAHKLRGIREAKGLSRRALGELTGIGPVHIAKMELGDVKETSEEKVEALASALDVLSLQIADEARVSDIQRWAQAHGYSKSTAQQFAQEGRIEGATKDDRGQWSVAIDAKKLPPTELTRARERDRYRKYSKDYQRRRRDALRAERRSSDDDPHQNVQA
jgi:transcriptional regulator with XRE-family HTH domain